jgi:hypothetical protein
VIRFLISEAKADFTIKNNFGYFALDIAYNTDVRTLFNEIISQQAGGHQSLRTMEENKN